ncbi:hypothetical protein K2173_001937 [Erythroxylum novogranatense]|uniref:ABC transporter domain-containing protein n=1 Tax=Erythroxylum novogranatense TaxID=1862640 RepID=A0AAV8SPW3_9ROSI|nr:hypothetical protein K2173_001937 [Erythroxylum novogranatense]
MAVLEHQRATIEINGLKFTYPGIDGHPPPGSKPLIDDFSLTLNSGDRCLLVGSNGAGWYRWRRDVAFAGFEVPIQMDVSAEKLIFGLAGIDPQRRVELIKVLDIDLSWRMHKVSDGQRRRVQICMPTIIYATHIFDGLEHWPTHIVSTWLTGSCAQLAMPMAKVLEISNLSLMRTVENWLRKERDEERRRRKERKASGLPEFSQQIEGSRVTGDPARRAVRAMNNGWAAGRLHSTVAGEENFVFVLSSNRVLRQ